MARELGSSGLESIICVIDVVDCWCRLTRGELGAYLEINLTNVVDAGLGGADHDGVRGSTDPRGAGPTGRIDRELGSSPTGVVERCATLSTTGGFQCGVRSKPRVTPVARAKCS